MLTGFETKVNPHPAMVKGLCLQAIIVGSRAMFEDMNRAIGASGMKPVIDRVFPSTRRGRLCVTCKAPATSARS